MRQMIRRETKLQELAFLERGWDDHEDVFAAAIKK